ncbi:oxamate carbamoyltransferase subunit AllH family protein [Actinomadura formosensis]|uniref:oxamate carbamoyltransferase subunit AllH family protein n=1 Tax=Actinomadura formosensis TaxID=60706 RepID=UPI003D93ACDC
MTALARAPIPLPARPGRRPPAAGAASLALRPLLDSPRRAARVIAVFPAALYLEMRGGAEPRVLAVVTSDAGRLPNAVVVVASRREHPFRSVREGADAAVGEGRVEADGLNVRVRRWWDPSPRLSGMQPATLARGVHALEEELTAAGALTAAGPAGGGLAGHPDPAALAAACAAGDLAGAVEAAERIVGLGPGLTPSGDDILCGLLVSLRLVGDAVRHGGAAVRLADWLGAAVTTDAGTRTTALAATLLHCAAAGGAGAEVAAVLRRVAGCEPPGGAGRGAVRRLLSVGHTSGTDLAHGVLAGCRAALALTATASARRAPRATA